MHLAAHSPAEAHAPKPIYRQLYFQVLTAIALGVTVGHFWPEIGANLKPLGDAFVKLVKMIIAPVIFLTVTTGIAGMSDLKKVGRVAGKAFAYFLTFSTLALLVGLPDAHVGPPEDVHHRDRGHRQDDGGDQDLDQGHAGAAAPRLHLNHSPIRNRSPTTPSPSPNRSPTPAPRRCPRR